MTHHIYTLPVYRRVLQYAYHHKADWSAINKRAPQHWPGQFVPSVNLGRSTGKTSSAVDFAEQFSDVVLVTATQAQADNIPRRNGAVRAFGPDHLAKLPPHNFQSTQPLFIFDDVPTKDTLEVLTRFRPERFIHLGAWG